MRGAPAAPHRAPCSRIMLMDRASPSAPKPTGPQRPRAATDAAIPSSSSSKTARGTTTARERTGTVGGMVLQHPVTQPVMLDAAPVTDAPAWGAVLGHAGTWLAALTRSSLTEREKALATTLFLRTYAHRSKREWQQAV